MRTPLAAPTVPRACNFRKIFRRAPRAVNFAAFVTDMETAYA